MSSSCGTKEFVDDDGDAMLIFLKLAIMLGKFAIKAICYNFQLKHLNDFDRS